MSQELAEVLGHYALGEAIAAHQVEGGFVDNNWIVDTDRGRYFLKRRHPRRRQPERLVLAQHELMAWLRKSGFPAPSIVPTKTGDSFLSLAGELYEVEHYIEGTPCEPERAEHLDAAAQTLARYHLCVEHFAPGAFQEQGVLYSPASACRALDELWLVWDVGRDPGLMQVAGQLRARIDALADGFDRHGALHHLVIHGDYYAGNLLFDGDRIVGLVDFDKANWQPRLAEIAEALIYFASPRPGHMTHLVYPGFLDRGRFARFLQNYSCTTDLEEGEVQALPDYICCIWLTMSLKRLLEGEACCPSPALHELLALGTWTSINAQQMTEIARSAGIR